MKERLIFVFFGFEYVISGIIFSFPVYRSQTDIHESANEGLTVWRFQLLRLSDPGYFSITHIFLHASLAIYDMYSID